MVRPTKREIEMMCTPHGRDLLLKTKVQEFIQRYACFQTDRTSEKFNFWQDIIVPSCLDFDGPYLKCAVCEKLMKSTPVMLRHYRELHYDFLPEGIFGYKSEYPCIKCNVIFGRKEHLITHYNSDSHEATSGQGNYSNNKVCAIADHDIIATTPPSKSSQVNRQNEKACAIADLDIISTAPPSTSTQINPTTDSETELLQFCQGWEEIEKIEKNSANKKLTLTMKQSLSMIAEDGSFFDSFDESNSLSETLDDLQSPATYNNWIDLACKQNLKKSTSMQL